MMEEWRPCPGYEDEYQVSNLGRIRSFHSRWPGRILATCPDKDGYPLVPLTKGGERHQRVVHRLVAKAFHGDKRNVLHNEVAHLDNDRRNARADNLRWVSKVENHSHKRIHGTHQAGESHPCAKLTAADVREIRSRAAAGDRPSMLAREFGVGGTIVRDIRDGKLWRSIQTHPGPSQ